MMHCGRLSPLGARHCCSAFEHENNPPKQVSANYERMLVDIGGAGVEEHMEG